MLPTEHTNFLDIFPVMDDRTKPIWQDRRYSLVSLYDMLRFYADRYLAIAKVLGQLELLCVDRVDDDIPDAEQRKLIMDKCHAIDMRCAEVDLVLSRESIVRILEALKNRSVRFREVGDGLRELSNRVADELKLTLLLRIPSEKKKYFEDPNSFWGEPVVLKFSISHDVEESAKSLALGRGTATVFHLMRIMEAGLRYLCGEAATFGISIPDPTSNRAWSGWIDPLEKEFRKDRKSKTDEWNALEPTYAQVASHLRTVSTAWRNPTMHVGTKYTSEEAEDIFNAVRGFMRHLASAKLKES